MNAKRSMVYYLLTIPFFFPNISFNLLDFDVSPLPLMSALIILATTSKKYPSTLYALLIPSFFSVPFILTTYGDWPYFMRLIGVYFTVPLVSMACYKVIDLGVDMGKIAENSIYISFMAALAQSLISIDVFSFLLQSRTTDSRGYNSLFAEPSFFGMATFIFCIVYYVANSSSEKKISSLPIVTSIISIILLSQSSLVILILIITMLLYLLVNLNLKNTALLIAMILIVVTAGVLIAEGSDSRALKVINLILTNPQDILLIDASISERVMHLYLSLKGSVNNFLMPNGFYDFHDLMIKEMAANQYFWWAFPSNKIMSGIGSALFEIGLISLITPGILILLSIKNKYNKGLLVFVMIAPILIYSNAINYASPYLSILIGVLAYGVKRIKYRRFLKSHKQYSTPLASV